MLKAFLIEGDESPVEVREYARKNGPLARSKNEYYGVYVTQPENTGKMALEMHETYLQDMNSKYVYPKCNSTTNIEDTNKRCHSMIPISRDAVAEKGGLDSERWNRK